jgi:glycosyltransferase involved in cell wall biosynthesis
MADKQRSTVNLLCVSWLPDYKVTGKIQPLIDSPRVEKIYLVRREPYANDKVTTYSPPAWMRKSLLLSESYRLLMVLFLCATKRIDAIIGYGMVLHGLFGHIGGRLFRKPVIQLILGKVEFDFFEKSDFRRRILKSMLDRAFAIGVRGENTYEMLADQGVPKERLFIAHNVFDFSKFPVPPEGAKKDIDVVNVGRIEPWRRLDVLLRSLAVVKKKHANLRAVIIGGGWTGDREYNRLLILKSTLGLDDNVEFLGTLPREEVTGYHHRARMFMMTSEADGLPMAMIEGLATGLPCVVPEDADITTVAKHDENALIVQVGDVDGFANAIFRLLDDPELYGRLSDGARQLRIDKAHEYSLAGISEVWDGVLVMLLDKINRR